MANILGNDLMPDDILSFYISALQYYYAYMVKVDGRLVLNNVIRFLLLF
jgi:hypothetical protein